jgi:glycosyltransferase involved in cell wall biosynthesis
MFHLNFLLLILRPFLRFPIRILVRQNATASSALAALPRYNRLLYRLLYRRADCILCQSEAMARDLRDSFSIPESLLGILPNPIDTDAINLAIPALPDAWPDTGPHLLAVGRLSPEKGFDVLLKSLAIVRKRFPSADLLIAGSGSEEPALKALSRMLSLDSAVRFVGHVAAPAAYFPGATFFVLSSRHEGLPNALLEAAAAGLPIVSTPASDGLVELIRQHPGVWIAAAPTVEALADTLTKALNAVEHGRRFHHSFIAPFCLRSAIAAWEELIDRFLADAPASHIRAQAKHVRP